MTFRFGQRFVLSGKDCMYVSPLGLSTCAVIRLDTGSIVYTPENKLGIRLRPPHGPIKVRV